MIKATLKSSIIDTNIVDLSMIDDKGRRIGARVELTHDIRTPDDNSEWLFNEVGEFFTVQVWATRNEEPFGAVQKHVAFRTKEQAKKHIAKKIEAIRKRYAKQFCVQ
jgi:hypothetical protein